MELAKKLIIFYFLYYLSLHPVMVFSTYTRDFFTTYNDTAHQTFIYKTSVYITSHITAKLVLQIVVSLPFLTFKIKESKM
jgi:uncharacterized membrane protein